MSTSDAASQHSGDGFNLLNRPACDIDYYASQLRAALGHRF